MEGVAISAWKKEQAKQYLQAAGKPDHPSWSADQLKSYIMEKRNQGTDDEEVARSCPRSDCGVLW